MDGLSLFTSTFYGWTTGDVGVYPSVEVHVLSNKYFKKWEGQILLSNPVYQKGGLLSLLEGLDALIILMHRAYTNFYQSASCPHIR